MFPPMLAALFGLGTLGFPFSLSAATAPSDFLERGERVSRFLSMMAAGAEGGRAGHVRGVGWLTQQGP